MCLLILGSLSGCTEPNGLALSPSEIDVPPCNQTEPVHVADVAKSARATCDLAGTPMVFPDGMTVTAPDVGGRNSYSERYSSTSHSDTYSLSNLGVYGIVAAQTTPDPKHTQWWGTKEGVKKEQQAFGMDDEN